MVAARQARAAHGLRDPLVERFALLPEMVVPPVLTLRQVRALGVQVVAGLRQDGHALARELAQAVDALLQEVGVVDDLVVVEEHDGVEAHDVGEHQSQVADGTVAGKADLLRQLAQAQLLHALLHQAALVGADDGDVEAGEARDDVLHLLGGLIGDGGLGGDQHDNLPDAANLLQRREQTRQLAGIAQRGGVVVRGDHAAGILSAARRHERRDYDDRIHARPLFRVRLRRMRVAGPRPWTGRGTRTPTCALLSVNPYIVAFLASERETARQPDGDAMRGARAQGSEIGPRAGRGRRCGCGARTSAPRPPSIAHGGDARPTLARKR